MNLHTSVTVDKDRGDRLRTWVRDIQAKTGFSITRLAKEAGVSHSLISRALDPNAAPPNFTADTILKLTQAGGIAFPDDHSLGMAEPANSDDIEPFDGEDPRASSLADSQTMWVVHTSQLTPVGILSGDRIIIDSGIAPKNYDIVAATVDDALGANRILRVFHNDFLVTPNHIIERDRGFYLDHARVRIIGTLTESWRTRS